MQSVQDISKLIILGLIATAVCLSMVWIDQGLFERQSSGVVAEWIE